MPESHCTALDVRYGPDLANTTLRPEKPGAANTAGAQVKFTSSGASKLKAVSGCQHSSEWVEAKLCLAPEGHTNLTPATAPAVTLESKSAHPDLCSGGSTLRLNDNSSAPTSSPCDALCPELLDPLCQLPADEENNLRASQGAGTPGGELELGARDPTRAWALSTVEEQEEGEEQREEEEEECPICTEPYGPGEHYLALLNCGHNLCVGCLHQLLGMTPRADPGRVCCPLCRQKTPMLEWEICQLQEELLQADGPQRPVPTAPATPLRPGPGPWGSLEHRYRLRFLAGPVGGRSCLPFLPCPPSLGIWLWTLRERGPCARRLSLLSLLALELLGLALIFMPLMLLGVLLMLLDRSSH
ncbi:ring finger protein-like [Acomys russatus]|uniref:ring finger protein-like n=1 Tax=Acomys russatus TaxID=60746 RepID=UPI0021E26D2D|nr:ring finger protein-like [Acomys russatus]